MCIVRKLVSNTKVILFTILTGTGVYIYLNKVQTYYACDRKTPRFFIFYYFK